MGVPKKDKKESTITIGKVAEQLGVTVRTLQYYDKEGLIRPSAKTAGGRRFYTKDDLLKLHQILSMKYLGFSLEEIRQHLTQTNSPQDVVKALELQKQMFREQIARLNKALEDTEILQQEAKQMNAVDFDRYAQIISMLQKKSESYWLFKLFNERLSAHINSLFLDNPDGWVELYQKWEKITEKTIEMRERRVMPESQEAQELAEEWWKMTLSFTGGDLSLIPELKKFEENQSGWSETMKEKTSLAMEYRNNILRIFFQKNCINPIANDVT